MNSTKNELKYYSSLLIKKFRDEESKFIVEGKKIVEEGINSNFKLEKLFVTNEFEKENSAFLNKFTSKHIQYSILKNQDFKKVSDTRTPQGIAAVFHKPILSQEENYSEKLIVFLDNISDPGNVGTIIRNCDWFGVKEIVLSKECADIYNPKTIRASMGSIFHLRIFENNNLRSTLQKFKSNGYSILSTDLEGKNIFEFKSLQKQVVIFSNEANGPSENVIEFIDDKITIPKLGNAESLNVASASAVTLALLSQIKKNNLN